MGAKYVFVTGGVVSGLGKGITVASLGRLFKSRGFKVVTQKFDPYINIDPGNLDPLEHGEVFVLDDGAQTDLDLGHYERFIGENLTENSAMTMGKIYESVLNKERAGMYKGRTVQVIPHITNEIKDRVQKAGNADIVITEVGGTVGDIESLPILEAIRQIAHDVGREDVVYVHITLVPYLDYAGEMKTKPSQHSVKELLSRGIQPDIIVCRSDRVISAELRDKLALFCNVEAKCIIQNTNAESIYQVPLLLEEEGFADVVCQKLRLPPVKPDLTEWRALVERQLNPKAHVTLGIVGQYVALHDAYLSVVEALHHAGVHHQLQINIKWVHDTEVEAKGAAACLSDVSGILIADGIDDLDSAGNSLAADFARQESIPFLGIGGGAFFGMKSSLKSAGMVMDKAAGSKQIKLSESKVADSYAKDVIEERFRGRFSFDTDSPLNQEEWLLFGEQAVAEYKEHPWYVCVQFRPEYKSALTKPNPIFIGFIKQAQEKNRG